MEDYRLEQTGQEVQRILNGAAMDANLQAEVERATDAEGTLQENIDAEAQARQDADGLLQQGIDDEAERAKDAEEANAGEIESIKALIPATATSDNKLADTNYVNSSIQTATAEYRGDYNVVTDLHLAIDATHAQIETLLPTVIAEADKNDYCYVMIPTSAQTPTEIAKIERYKMTSDGWKFEYDVNNSTFTAEEWAAIKSGITSGLVAKLNALPTNADLMARLAGIEGDIDIVDGKVATIESKVPATASSDNKLVDQNQMNSSISTATATYRGDWNIVTDLHLAVDATRSQIAALLPTVISTADNNDYCYVEIPTSAETPTQIERVERFKYNGTAWAYEYVLNNSGFTSAQWAAINSMITSGLVAKLSALPTNADLLAMLAQKQDNLTFDTTPTENSTNPVTSGGVFAADKALSDAIEAILLLIPSAASALNKLVDTAQMNSSISTATATFRGTYNLVSNLGLGIDATEEQIAAALSTAISTADNNDYSFVQIPTSSQTPTQIARTDRYKFNGTAWAFEYTLNTSGFTADQWAAINSAITSTLVAKLNALPTAAELQETLGVLTSGITAINQKIPSTASQSNKLVDNASMESYIAQVINILDASFNVTSTDGHITLHITQTDGVITSVLVQSTDIASAADLTLVTNRVTTAEGNISSLTGRMGTAETNIANLQQLYNNLQQSKPVPVTALPSTGQQQGVIYRLAGTTSYSDYMWNGSSWVLMATYNNALDDVPISGSENLVKSGGVAKRTDKNYYQSQYVSESLIPNGALTYNPSKNPDFVPYAAEFVSYRYSVKEGETFFYTSLNPYANNVDNLYIIIALDENGNVVDGQCVKWDSYNKQVYGYYTIPYGISEIIISLIHHRNDQNIDVEHDARKVVGNIVLSDTYVINGTGIITKNIPFSFKKNTKYIIKAYREDTSAPVAFSTTFNGGYVDRDIVVFLSGNTDTSIEGSFIASGDANALSIYIEHTPNTIHFTLIEDSDIYDLVGSANLYLNSINQSISASKNPHVTPSYQKRDQITIEAPFIGNDKYIDNVVSIINRSHANGYAWGNAAIAFMDANFVERCAVGYSRNKAILPNEGYVANTLYCEIGNAFTSDGEDTDFRVIRTLADYASRGLPSAYFYPLEILSDGTINIRVDQGKRINMIGGDVYAQNGLILKSPNGNLFRVVVANDGTLSTEAVS